MPTRIRFTHKGIEAIKPRDKRFIVWDAGTRGFGLRVTPNGVKSFIYCYRFAGKPQLLTLGNVDAITLEQAFAKVAEAKKSVATARHMAMHENKAPPADLNPAFTKQKLRQVRQESPTVEDLWQTYQEKRFADLRPKTILEYRRMMKTDVLPEIGDMKIIDVRPRDIKALLNKVETRGPVLANRTHTHVAALFNYAVQEFLVDVSPVKSVRRPTREKPRERALKEEAELRGFFAGVADLPGPGLLKLALQLILACAARPGEVCGMRWADVDLESNVWTIPEIVDKTHRERRLPLSAFAVSLINEASEFALANAVYVFPTSTGKSAIDTLILSEAVRENLSIFQKHGVEAFRPHDLRRTARTWLSRLKVPESIAERCLGHTWGSKIQRTYDTHGFEDEMREALETLGTHLTAARAGPIVRALKAA